MKTAQSKLSAKRKREDETWTGCDDNGNSSLAKAPAVKPRSTLDAFLKHNNNDDEDEDDIFADAVGEEHEATAEPAPKVAPVQRPGVIRRLTEFDVLMGRGQPFHSYTGNKKMTKIVHENKPIYQATKREERRLMAEKVLRQVVATGARFLRRVGEVDDVDSGAGESINNYIWEEVDEEVAFNKISHALRGKDRSKPRTAGAANNIPPPAALPPPRAGVASRPAPPREQLPQPRRNEAPVTTLEGLQAAQQALLLTPPNSTLRAMFPRGTAVSSLTPTNATLPQNQGLNAHQPRGGNTSGIQGELQALLLSASSPAVRAMLPQGAAVNSRTYPQAALSQNNGLNTQAVGGIASGLRALQQQSSSRASNLTLRAALQQRAALIRVLQQTPELALGLSQTVVNPPPAGLVHQLSTSAATALAATMNPASLLTTRPTLAGTFILQQAAAAHQQQMQRDQYLLSLASLASTNRGGTAASAPDEGPPTPESVPSDSMRGSYSFLQSNRIDSK